MRVFVCLCAHVSLSPLSPLSLLSPLELHLIAASQRTDFLAKVHLCRLLLELAHDLRQLLWTNLIVHHGHGLFTR